MTTSFDENRKSYMIELMKVQKCAKQIVSFMWDWIAIELGLDCLIFFKYMCWHSGGLAASSWLSDHSFSPIFSYILYVLATTALFVFKMK